jgi:hypothetical protein
VRVFIDLDTASWGMAHNVVVANLDDEDINELEDCSDSEIRELAQCYLSEGKARFIQT